MTDHTLTQEPTTPCATDAATPAPEKAYCALLDMAEKLPFVVVKKRGRNIVRTWWPSSSRAQDNHGEDWHEGERWAVAFAKLCSSSTALPGGVCLLSRILDAAYGRDAEPNDPRLRGFLRILELFLARGCQGADIARFERNLLIKQKSDEAYWEIMKASERARMLESVARMNAAKAVKKAARRAVDRRVAP